MTAGGVAEARALKSGGWILASCVAVSLLAHAAGFWVFRIVYPPPVGVTPPPADVSLLNLSDPAHDGVRRWIEAEDPALLYAAQESVPAGLLATPYVPSYAEIRSAPKGLPADAAGTPNVGTPPARDVLSLLNGAGTGVAEKAFKPERSGVRFSGALAGRGVETAVDGRGHDEPGFANGTGSMLEPARFLVAVTDKGEVRYAFLQSSSGDKAMDDESEERLLSMHFAPSAKVTATGAPSPEALEWGLASFYWGDDAYGERGGK